MHSALRAWVALILVASPLAGCFGSDAPAATGEDPAPAADEGAPGDGAADGGAASPSPPASSGGQQDPSASASEPAPANASAQDPAPSPADPPAPAAPVQVTTPFAWNGTFVPALCVPDAEGSCDDHAVGERRTRFALPAQGTPLALDATLTWSAATPATAELGLVLLAVKTCGERCYEGRVLGEPVGGGSPLTLAVPGIVLHEGETLDLHAYRDPALGHPAGTPLYAKAETEQAFSLQAALVERVAPSS